MIHSMSHVQKSDRYSLVLSSELLRPSSRTDLTFSSSSQTSDSSRPDQTFNSYFYFWRILYIDLLIDCV